MQAQALAKGIEERLGDLKSMVSHAISKAEKADSHLLPSSLHNRMEQAQQWLHHPQAFDNGSGNYLLP